jgi:hypothetical protein
VSAATSVQRPDGGLRPSELRLVLQSLPCGHGKSSTICEEITGCLIPFLGLQPLRLKVETCVNIQGAFQCWGMETDDWEDCPQGFRHEKVNQPMYFSVERSHQTGDMRTSCQEHPTHHPCTVCSLKREHWVWTQQLQRCTCCLPALARLPLEQPASCQLWTRSVACQLGLVLCKGSSHARHASPLLLCR